MSKHILFNEQGSLVARYDSTIHGDNIPAGAVEVDEALFFQTINETDGVWALNADGSITKGLLPAFIPSVVSMRQARLALFGAGMLDAVDESISLMPDPIQRKQAEIDWEFAATVDRDSHLVNGLAGTLGLTEQMLDDLFLTASKL